MCIDEMMNKLNVYQIMVFFYFLSFFYLSLSLSFSSMTMTPTPTTTTMTTFGDANQTHDEGSDLDLVSK
jgi:hypothetical protein